jgi:hypothetical protein
LKSTTFGFIQEFLAIVGDPEIQPSLLSAHAAGPSPILGLENGPKTITICPGGRRNGKILPKTYKGNNMKIFKAPTKATVDASETSVFLAGSIDMGSAENWQTRLENDLKEEEDLVLLNPRRDDWDSTWVQDPTPGTQFHEQVSWELDHLDLADLVVVYFADSSMSPITLLEFGLLASNYEKDVIVYCTDKFYRYGNVQIVADRYHIPIFDKYDEFLHYIKSYAYQEKIG